MEECAPVILVDTSVWVDYFRKGDSPEASMLARALEDEEDIAILPIILTEVLQGFVRDEDFQRARDLLTRLPSVPVRRESYVQAAQLYRALRRKGVTVRGAVDCVIAQAAIESGAELLTLDRDFSAIARHSSLALSGK